MRRFSSLCTYEMLCNLIYCANFNSAVYTVVQINNLFFVARLIHDSGFYINHFSNTGTISSFPFLKMNKRKVHLVIPPPIVAVTVSYK